MIVVQKYGGTSVAGPERIMSVARRVAKTQAAGHSVVVVLSAQGDTTDDLIYMARAISKNPSRREMDMLLSTGEQQSVALMAIALHSLGVPAISLTGLQAGVISSSAYSNARIKRVEAERIQNELDKRQVVIVAGFQGTNRYGDITTLGRGGSDTTAVALAAALGADICEIYTDVDGVYTADPRVVETAVKLNEISYDEMLELASLGAKVLQKRSVELAKKYSIKLVVRSSMTEAEGTLVKEEAIVEGMFVSGVAIDKNVSRVSLVAVKAVPGIAFKVFSLLARQNISVDIILQSIGRDNTKDITFTVAKEDLDDTLKTLAAHKENIGYKELMSDNKSAKLSVVGAGMATNPGVASAFFEALYEVGVNIDMISTSEIKISVLVDAEKADIGARAAHDKFIRVNEMHAR